MQLVAPPQLSQERISDSGIVSPETLKYFAASLRVSEESVSEFVKAGMPTESIVDARKWLKCNPNHHRVPLSGSSYVGERNSMDRPHGWGRQAFCICHAEASSVLTRNPADARILAAAFTRGLGAMARSTEKKANQCKIGLRVHVAVTSHTESLVTDTRKMAVHPNSGAGCAQNAILVCDMMRSYEWTAGDVYHGGFQHDAR
jgi:hypothetical protein